MNKRNDSERWLLENFNYIDSITMVDDKGTIVIKQRFNPRYTDEENAIHNKWCIGKNVLEVFPSLSHNDSSLLQAATKGKITHYEAQRVINSEGKLSVTNNITFPIIMRGRIIGAVELSRDITNFKKNIKQNIELNSIAKSTTARNAKYSIHDILGENYRMREIKNTILKIADSNSSVMVYGETGTGKELVVSAIHNASERRNKPFVAINCAALPETILEGLLFGSRKGAFTGAENKKGMFEEANGGTIYLDEINSMPIILQAKLLRVLQEKAVTPLGTSQPVKLDVRIIASTNKPLNKIVSSGQMREDILYRLNTISIDIPPLRERLDDIVLLSEHFVAKYNNEFNKRIKGISDEVYKFFLNKSWKGNVRELEHVIESAMNLASDAAYITLGDLPAYLEGPEMSEEIIPEKYEVAGMSLTESIEIYEKKLVIDALRQSNWKIVDAAKILKIPRTSLQYKMEKYDIKKKNPLT